MKTINENGLFRKRSPEWNFLKTLFSRVRVDKRKRNFSKKLRTNYQFQYTPHNIRNLLKVAEGPFPFFSFIIGLIPNLNACFQANLASSWLFQEAAELYQVTLATGVKRRKVRSPLSLSLFLPLFWHVNCFCDFEERHNNIYPHQRNSKMASIYHFAGS